MGTSRMCRWKGLEFRKGKATARVGTCSRVLSKWKEEETKIMVLGSVRGDLLTHARAGQEGQTHVHISKKLII